MSFAWDFFSEELMDMLIFKGGYHWRKIGEGHKFIILVQVEVIQFYLRPVESHTFVFPLNIRGVLYLVNCLGDKGVKLVLYSLVISLINESIKDNPLPSLTC